MSDKDKARLQHILDAILEVQDYTKNATFKIFSDHSMMQNASIRQLEVIGEACNYLSDNIKEENEDIPWKQIIGLRNILIHQYFGVDLQLVWNIIETDLKPLKQRVEQLLENK